MIPFVKTHALGNDFILVEHTTSLPADCPSFANRVCHRNFGVGADGLILWNPADDLFKLRIFNRDGSEAECSGNGLRCAAAYLIESGRWPKDEIRLAGKLAVEWPENGRLKLTSTANVVAEGNCYEAE